MFRAFVSAAVLACVLILAPTSESEKEIGSASASPLTEALTDLLVTTAQAHPCAIIVMASNEPSVTPLPKPKPKHLGSKQKKKKVLKSAKHKKKFAAHGGASKHKVPSHHTSHAPDHHDSIPQKIFASHGPLHLTSPPGCG